MKRDRLIVGLASALSLSLAALLIGGIFVVHGLVSQANRQKQLTAQDQRLAAGNHLTATHSNHVAAVAAHRTIEIIHDVPGLSRVITLEGRSGKSGPPGPPGVRGITGVAGQRGATGAAGASVTGPTGPTGPGGPGGANATAAEIMQAVQNYCALSDGCIGAMGLGPTDAQIASAVAGYCQVNGNCAGPPGPMGDPGVAGSDGTNGIDGVSPIVTQLPAGSSQCPLFGGALITDGLGDPPVAVCSGA